ncbi:hypothetical protein ACS0TY_008509 [Phlomoides rotata]
MIRSINVIFNERVMYKDRHNTVASDSERSGPVFVQVDDVSESPLNEIVEDPQSEESTDTPQPSPPKALRRSDRPHMPNQKYLNYLLLTDRGEPECFEEACQTADASKWELAMNDKVYVD